MGCLTMNDIATLANKAIQQAGQQPAPRGDSPTIRKLFLVLHGSYGSLFTTKFSTGERDANGKDKGIRAAMLVWEAALAKYSPDTIETAAKRLSEECPEYPPNLPQFEAICRAVMPRKTFSDDGARRLPPPEVKPIGPVEFEVKHDGRDWARKLLARQAAGDRISAGSLDMAKKALRMQEGA
jgi:hypothetical protein